MKKIFSRLLDNAGIHIFLIVSYFFYYISKSFFIKPNESFVELILPYKLIVVYLPIFIFLILILMYDLYYSFILLY